MSFDWSTFTLEIINFIVLVWILKRLFYHPILDSIARRQAAIAKTLEDAKAIESQAQKMKEDYEQRQAEWEKERLANNLRFEKEIANKRQQKLLEIEQLMTIERKKNDAAEAEKRVHQQHIMDKTAVDQATRFAARLLERISTPYLDERIADMVVEDLNKLSVSQREKLALAANEPDTQLNIVSAHGLSESAQLRLSQAIEAILNLQLPVLTHTDSSFLGGVRLMVNSWVLQANLADELAFFRESASSEG